MLQQGNDHHKNERYVSAKAALQGAETMGSGLLDLARALITFWAANELPAAIFKRDIQPLDQRGRCRVANLVARESKEPRLVGAAISTLVNEVGEGQRYLQPLIAEKSPLIIAAVRQEISDLEIVRDIAAGQDRSEVDARIACLKNSGAKGFFTDEAARCKDRLARLQDVLPILGQSKITSPEHHAGLIIPIAIFGEKSHWLNLRDMFREIRDSDGGLARQNAEAIIREAIEILQIQLTEAAAKKSHKSEVQTYSAALKRVEEWAKSWQQKAKKSESKPPRLSPVELFKRLLEDTNSIAQSKDQLIQLSGLLREEATPLLAAAIDRAVQVNDAKTLRDVLFPVMRSGASLTRVDLLRKLPRGGAIQTAVVLECFDLVALVGDVAGRPSELRDAARNLLAEIGDFTPVFSFDSDNQMRLLRGVQGSITSHLGVFRNEAGLRNFCDGALLDWPDRNAAFSFLQVAQRSGIIGKSSMQFQKPPQQITYTKFLKRCTPEEIGGLKSEFPETASWVITSLRPAELSPEQISAAARWVLSVVKTSQTLWWNTAKFIQVTPKSVAFAFIKEYYAIQEWKIGFMLGVGMIIESEAANEEKDAALRLAMRTYRFPDPRPDPEWLTFSGAEELLRLVPISERPAVAAFAETTITHSWKHIDFIIRVWDKVRSWFLSDAINSPLARGF